MVREDDLSVPDVEGNWDNIIFLGCPAVRASEKPLRLKGGGVGYDRVYSGTFRNVVGDCTRLLVFGRV